MWWNLMNYYAYSIDSSLWNMVKDKIGRGHDTVYTEKKKNKEKKKCLLRVYIYLANLREVAF